MFNNIFRRGNRQGRGGGRGRGLGMGDGTKPGSGPSGNCVCPKCGYTMVHQVGERCVDLNCPQCGTRMVRE